MSSRPRTKTAHALVLALLATTALAGCSDIYFDRRDTVSFGADDAVANNKAIHTADPWPRYVGDRNIAFNGAKMESAFERYRTNRVIAPHCIGTSTTYQDSGSGGQNNSAPVGPPVTTAPAAPVK